MEYSGVYNSSRVGSSRVSELSAAEMARKESDCAKKTSRVI
jgi:hypothetical protein